MLDERLGFGDLIRQTPADSRCGKNTQLRPADLLRQSIYSRLPGFEDVNDAERLRPDPTIRLIGSEKISRSRRGMADLHRRAEVSRKAAERYLDAFASLDQDAALEDLIRRLGEPKQGRGRRVPALPPFADDRVLLQTISRGEFAINGFRNRDLRAILFARAAKSPEPARR